MSDNKMLIDAAHPEETRVVVLRGGRVEEFDYESAARKQLRGNIYLAKVTRVEPALQAAFVDYGGNRHGFLAFNEIHPDYYQIPVADRLALLEEEAAEAVEEDDDDELEAEATDSSDAADDASDSVDDEDDDENDDLHDHPVDLDQIIEEDEDDDDPIDDSDDDEEEEEEADVRATNASDLDASPENAPEDESSPSAADLSHEQTDTPQSSDDDDPGSRSTVLPQSMQRDEQVSEDFAPQSVDAETESVTEVEVEAQAQVVASNDNSEAEKAEGTAPDFISAAAEGDAAEATGQSEETADHDDHGSDDDGAEADDVVEARSEASEDDLEEKSEATEGRRTRRSRGGRGRRSSSRGGNPDRRRRQPRGRRRSNGDEGSDEETGSVDQVGNEDALEELPSRPRRSRRSYKIQEVVKRRQVMLIQVVKEERGNKGAALTTYLSLAGRYTVLMPNTARGGGISRKITAPQDRKRLKAIAAELDVPEGMGLIIRTAGAARTKQEIRRDFEYLLRLWESVRELTLQSTAPALVYEEGDLIKRSIRDLYNKDVDQVMVAGEEAYRGAKNFMRMLMPSHAKNVIHYEDPEPLFTRHGIERQLNAMFSPYVHLPSGGYLVINQTEALVAIDVNSGRSTREFSIEETALNTNLEAADEVARQLKLRDLAGLVVVDFIDMEERRNNRNVERRMRDALREDRARIQVGRISPFGLLEMSRQRLRTGVLEGSTSPCPHCQGTGIIRSVESVALAVLRGLEDTVMGGCRHALIAYTTAEVALYILNNKREFVIAMEQRLGMPIAIEASSKMIGATYSIEKGEAPAAPVQKVRADAVSVDWGFDEDGESASEETEETAKADDKPAEGKSRRRRRRRGGRRSGERSNTEDENVDADSLSASDASDDEDADGSSDDDSNGETAEANADGEGDKSTRRRRRGRRGGRRNRSRNRDENTAENGEGESDEGDELAASAESDDGNEDHGAGDSQPTAEAPEEASPLTATSSEEETQPAIANAASLVTPIEIKTASDKAETATNEAPEATVSADDDSAPAAEFVEPPIADHVADDQVNGEQAADLVEETSETPRRSRGEPVSSAPRVERIKVSPDRPAAAETQSGEADAASGEGAETTAEKPARRGWWQRKLLGEA